MDGFSYEGHPSCFLSKRVIKSVKAGIGESMESNCSMIEKNPPKGVSFSDFICTFAMPCYDFRLFSNCNSKISEKSDTAKSWATFCCSGTYK